MSKDKTKQHVNTMTQAIWDSFDLFKEDSEADSISIIYAGETAKALVTILENSSDDWSGNSIQVLAESSSWLGAHGLQVLLVDAMRSLPRGTSSLKPGLYYASGIAHETAQDLKSARGMFLESRKYARAQKQNLLAISVAIDLGRLAFQDEDLNQARSWYGKALDEATLLGEYLLQATVLTNISATYLDSDPSEAAKFAEQSLDIKREYRAPSSSVLCSLGNLGIAEAKCGAHEEALELFEDALEIAKGMNDPAAHARALLNVAIEKSLLGDFKNAKGIFRKALRLVNKADDKETRRLLQQAFAVRAAEDGDYRQAERMFAELHRTWLDYGRLGDAAIALHDRALCLAKLGSLQIARDTLNQALTQFEKLKERDWQRRCLLMKAIELEIPSSDERTKILCEATNIRGGKDKELRLISIRSLWKELLDRGDYKQASVQLNRESSWLSKNPEELSERLHAAAMELLSRDRFSESEILLRNAVSLLRPNDIAVPWLRQDLAIALSKTGEYDEAIRLVRRNRELAKRQENRLLEMQSVGNLGELEHENGNAAKAIPFLESAIVLAKNMQDLGEEAFWLNNLALALADNGDVAKARKTLRRAIKNAEVVHDIAQVARAWGSLGVISAKVCSFKDAVEHYDQAILRALECDDKAFASEMMYDKAAALYHQGVRTEALTEAKKALELAHTNNKNDLAHEVGTSAAVWSIEWRRPAQAGSFLAAAFLCNLLTEAAKIEPVVGVFVIARQDLGAGQYRQFSQSVKRRMSKSIGSEEVSHMIDRIEMKINKELGH